jgi:hypothetical protein
MQEILGILFIKYLLCRKSRWCSQLITICEWQVQAPCPKSLLTGISLSFHITLEWMYIKRCSCAVLSCLSSHYVKLAALPLPLHAPGLRKIKHFYWGKNGCAKKIWTWRTQCWLSVMHLDQTQSTPVMSHLLRWRTLWKACHLLSALSITDKDGPDMEYSQTAALMCK